MLRNGPRACSLVPGEQAGQKLLLSFVLAANARHWAFCLQPLLLFPAAALSNLLPLGPINPWLPKRNKAGRGGRVELGRFPLRWGSGPTSLRPSSAVSSYLLLSRLSCRESFILDPDRGRAFADWAAAEQVTRRPACSLCHRHRRLCIIVVWLLDGGGCSGSGALFSQRWFRGGRRRRLAQI